MAQNRSPTSTTTETTTTTDLEEEMASYSQATEATSAQSSPNHRIVGAHHEDDNDGLEWYDTKTPELIGNEFHFQEDSPDLLQADFSYTHSLRDHATYVRKSIVLSESMDSVYGSGLVEPEQTERTTQLAMTNSPSFSALANILERKEAKFHTKPLVTVTPIIEQPEEHSSYQPSPLSVEQKPTRDSPNLIQFDDDFTPSQPTSAKTISHPVPYNNAPASPDIFKTPEVTQSQRFPHQEYTSMLTPVGSSPVASKTEEQEEAFKPQPLPKSPQKAPQRPPQSPFSSPRYAQRSASMPVVATLSTTKDKKDKRRSFMNIFRSKRSFSSSTVPKKSSSFSVPSPTVEEAPAPEPKTIKTSKSFQMPKSEPQTRTAQRSTSSTSLFAAFKRKKSQTFTQETSPKPQQKAPEPPTPKQNSPEPVINLEPSPKIDDTDDQDDTFSLSSGEFNEDFNNLKISEHNMLSPERPTNKRLSQISQSEKRLSQHSQGETLFPKNLSAQEVESIVSMERNRSISRQSMSSRRQSMASSVRYSQQYNSIDQEIPRRPSMSSSIQMSPSGLAGLSPEFKDYLSGDNDDDDEEGDLFDVEEFSNRLEFDTIADQYEPEEPEEDITSQFAEFADYIDFGGALDLDLDLNFDVNSTRSPLSQPPLMASPQLTNASSAMNESVASSSAVPSPSLRDASPLSSPFLQQSAYIPPNTQSQRPVSMSFRGLKAPAFNTLHQSNSSESLRSARSSLSQPSSLRKQQRRVVFSSKITLFDVYAEDEYDRKPDVATCNQLTPQLAMRIKTELNELKSEMEVHEDSRCYTHFF